MIADEARGVGATMPVVDPHESGVATGLHLALVLEHLIGLDDREGELPAGVLLQVLAPDQRVLERGVGLLVIAAAIILAHTDISTDRSPAGRRYPSQPRQHPSFPSQNPK